MFTFPLIRNLKIKSFVTSTVTVIAKKIYVPMTCDLPRGKSRMLPILSNVVCIFVTILVTVLLVK